MHSNTRHQMLSSLLSVMGVLSLASLALAETAPFSFDRALQIYNDVKTAGQLTQYLESASSADQKDYRFTLYRIRGYYANFQFENGDALVEEGVSGARKAGLTDAQVGGIRDDLGKQRDYWQNRLRDSLAITHTGSGGESTAIMLKLPSGSASQSPTSGKGLTQGHSGSGGHSTAHGAPQTE